MSDEGAYSPIFNRFVDSQKGEADQLSGLVAYGLYKVAKREWAAAFRSREGRGPSEGELRQCALTWAESRLRGLDDQAENILSSYADTVIDVAKPQIREDALRGRAWVSVAQSIAASFLYTLLLIVLLIALRIAGVDLLSILTTLARP